MPNPVSTHSRPKAAGYAAAAPCRHSTRFNTQPPEGGWWIKKSLATTNQPFQHTAARRRLVYLIGRCRSEPLFQHTAARRRLGRSKSSNKPIRPVSTHSRPKAAGGDAERPKFVLHVSTHSRPKAAGFGNFLVNLICVVSTHSRPKAAGPPAPHPPPAQTRFNTQPPEGGWATRSAMSAGLPVSTHSRPKAAGGQRHKRAGGNPQFQHTAARRRLALPPNCFH